MAIDFYAVVDRSFDLCLFSLSIEDFDLIGKVNHTFELQTGIFLDPYARVTLSAPHCQLWGKLMGKFLDEERIHIASPLRNLQNLLLTRSTPGDGLVLLGD